MKTEVELRQEYELVNQLKPGKQATNDYFQLITLYPSALSEKNYCRNRYRDVLPEGELLIPSRTVNLDCRIKLCF